MPGKLTTESFIEKAIVVHGDEYDYSLVNYIKSKLKVKIICKKHGVFEVTPNSHLSFHGCPGCYGTHKKSNIEFINEANVVHNYKFNYSKVDYKGNNYKVKIICKEHGLFTQTPSSHLQGVGCPRCGGTSKKNLDEFINIANMVHNYKYNYSLVEYVNCRTKIRIICKVHGVFEQDAGEHLHGKGCQACSGNLPSTAEEFIIKAEKIHNNKYDYSLVKYINSCTKVKIICKKHGIFEQIPNDHLRGSGCSVCPHYISGPEIIWLDSLKIPNDKDHRNVYIKVINVNRKRGFKVDGFDPKTNTVYEFNGDYWHGNPLKFNTEDYNSRTHCTFGELYQRTLDKEKMLKEAGYNVVSIWESDFKELTLTG